MGQHAALPAAYISIATPFALKITGDQVLKVAALGWENNLLQCIRPAAATDANVFSSLSKWECFLSHLLPSSAAA